MNAVASGFETVFDLGEAGFRYWILLVLAIAASWFAMLFHLWWRKGEVQNRKEDWRGFLAVGLVLAVFFTWFFFVKEFFDYRSLRAVLQGGRAGVVEGAVEDFVPMPPGGHAEESFRVGDQTFKYSGWAISPGFNKDAAHGGPIREGLLVKVWYHRGEILRLDVWRDSDR